MRWFLNQRPRVTEGEAFDCFKDTGFRVEE
jgi:hypothetical protein